MITATRFHDFSCGHRVVGHEGKCAFLHGHNYRVHFTAQSRALDKVGRVVDFSVLKSTLCQWLEDNWDHKFLAWQFDKVMLNVTQPCRFPSDQLDIAKVLLESVIFVPFNPTAENMAHYLLTQVGPNVLPGDVRLIRVVVEETRKCTAAADL